MTSNDIIQIKTQYLNELISQSSIVGNEAAYSFLISESKRLRETPEFKQYSKYRTQKHIKEWLRKYPFIKKSTQNIKQQIENVLGSREAYYDISAYTMQPAPSYGGISDKTARKAMKAEALIDRSIFEYTHVLEEELRMSLWIENALKNTLTEKEKNIIELMYFKYPEKSDKTADRQRIRLIASESHYEEAQCYRLQKSALEKLYKNFMSTQT